MSKKVVIVSMAVAGLVGAAALIDMITAVPFGKMSIAMDITFLIAAVIVGYMAYDTLNELK